MSGIEWAGLAAATFAASLLYSVTGFGFALLAAPLYLLLLGPANGVRLVVILATALSVLVLPQIRQAVARGLLLRLTLGALVGVPLGLLAFRLIDPQIVRALLGAVSVAVAGLLAVRQRRPPESVGRLRLRPGLDLTAGAISGGATALIGVSGPPVLIYLMLGGVAASTVRATLLAYFLLTYAATLTMSAATIGIPGRIWGVAGLLVPFAVFGGLVGKPLGDRLGPRRFAVLAIAVLAVAGLYILATALARAAA